MQATGEPLRGAQARVWSGSLNRWAYGFFAWIGVPLLTAFFVGPYGLITMGVTYALAIVLPVVTTFFFVFAMLEDSGYLPRLAVMSNRVLRGMGLNGKAVLPMVLGLGCDTMATLTTRILETRKERMLVTLLLALGVPCSAQLSVILALMQRTSRAATLVWLAVVIGTAARRRLRGRARAARRQERLRARDAADAPADAAERRSPRRWRASSGT